jgi:hypothetical protein
VFVLFYTPDAGFTSYATIEMVEVVGAGPAGGGAHFGTSVTAMGDLDGNGVSWFVSVDLIWFFISIFVLVSVLEYDAHTLIVCTVKYAFFERKVSDLAVSSDGDAYPEGGVYD